MKIKEIKRNGVDDVCKVSILVPVYNVERYLIQCMESLVQQTLKEIEIICIDDGSTDRSSSILDEYKKRYSCVRVIHKNNTGYGNSMNIGLQSANGEYIGIVESDDFVEINMFEKLYNLSKMNCLDVVKSCYFSYENGVDEYQKIILDRYNDILNPVADEINLEASLPIWTSLYKKDFLCKNTIRFNETPGASYQDVGFGFKVLSCAKKILFLEEAFYHYRTDNENSSVRSTSKVYCICDEFEEIWNFLSRRNDLNEFFRYRVPEYQHHHYVINCDRMASRYKERFIKRMIEDFSAMEKKSLLRREYWKDEEAWFRVKMMIRNPESMMHKSKIKIQNQHMYKIAFQTILNESSKVFIYGAGKVGREVARYLLKKKIKPIGFFVSDICDQPRSVMDIRVEGIEAAKEEDKEALILISVKEADIYPIMQKLEYMKFKNVLAMTLEMRKGILRA